MYFSVSKARFERHLDLIRDAGMRGCSIAEAIANPGTARVAISFDDGDLGQAVAKGLLFRLRRESERQSLYLDDAQCVQTACRARDMLDRKLSCR